MCSRIGPRIGDHDPKQYKTIEIYGDQPLYLTSLSGKMRVNS